MKKTDLAIIGSGLSALNLIKELRKAGDQRHITVLTVEAGHFYSKPMLSNALSKSKTPESLPVQTAQTFAEQFKIELLAHSEVLSLDLAQQSLCYRAAGEHKEGASQTLEWATLVLAMGAVPVALSSVGVDVQAPVFTVNQLSEYEHFYQQLTAMTAQRGAANVRVGIIGSGLIGCEFANDLANQGYPVTVVDVADRPMARMLPAELSTALAERLAALGVQWLWSQSVSRIRAIDAEANVENEASGVVVETAQGASLEVDLVLSAIGLQPNVALAQAAGLTCGPGVHVDQMLQTSHSAVYALGDCAIVAGISLQYVLPLMTCARSLAKTLMGQVTPVGYPAMPVVVKTPACPTVVAIPPTVPSDAQWRVHGEGIDLTATLVGSDQQVLGFALMGDAIKQKNILAKELPDWLTVDD